MPEVQFAWSGIIMIMTPTPMKNDFPDAGCLVKAKHLLSLHLTLEVTRGRFSDMLRMLEAKCLKDFRFTLEDEADGSWPIYSWGMSTTLAADIGQRDALVSTRSIFMAMPPDRPAEGRTIDIELAGYDYADHEETYWTIQQDNLRRFFPRKVKERIEQKEIRQLSVFALAPQPLLMELGHLLGDIVPVAVHQRYREPPTWRWQPDQPAIAFRVGEYSELPGVQSRSSLR